MSTLNEIERFKHGANTLEIFGPGRNERQAPVGLEQSHFGHRGFDGDGIRFDEVDVHQLEIAIVEAAGFGEIAGTRGMHKASHFRGNFVGSDGDEAVSTEGDEGKGERIVAGEDEEVCRNLAEDRAHLGDVAGSFFYADDVFDLRKTENGGGFDVDAGAALDAVEDYGESDVGGDGLEVLVEAFLGGLIVVRRDGKDAVGAERF